MSTIALTLGIAALTAAVIPTGQAAPAAPGGNQQSRIAVPHGSSITEVGPFCNEQCPDAQGIQDVCDDVAANDPKILSCTPSPNDDGDECWVEDYDDGNHDHCPFGYVVRCTCFSDN